MFNEVLPEYTAFFEQHFNPMKYEYLRDLCIVSYRKDNKIVCAVAIQFIKMKQPELARYCIVYFLHT